MLLCSDRRHSWCRRWSGGDRRSLWLEVYRASGANIGSAASRHIRKGIGVLDLTGFGVTDGPRCFAEQYNKRFATNGSFFLSTARRVATWHLKPHGMNGDGKGHAKSEGEQQSGQSPDSSSSIEDELKHFSDDELGLVRADAVNMCPIKWLWQYRFAEGEMAPLSGDGGLGKSSILLHIAARISRGDEWPDRSGQAPLGRVLIVSAEDSRETTLAPRLMAMGAIWPGLLSQPPR